MDQSAVSKCTNETFTVNLPNPVSSANNQLTYQWYKCASGATISSGDTLLSGKTSRTLNISGLTTAASIWMTAALGVLFGIGFFFPAVVSTFLTLGILSAFRWIENRIPAQFYAQFVVRFARTATIPEAEMRKIGRAHV